MEGQGPKWTVPQIRKAQEIKNQDSPSWDFEGNHCWEWRWKRDERRTGEISAANDAPLSLFLIFSPVFLLANFSSFHFMELLWKDRDCKERGRLFYRGLLLDNLERPAIARSWPLDLRTTRVDWKRPHHLVAVIHPSLSRFRGLHR